MLTARSRHCAHQLASATELFSPYLTAQHACAVQPLKAHLSVWQTISYEGRYSGYSCALTATMQACMLAMLSCTANQYSHLQWVVSIRQIKFCFCEGKAIVPGYFTGRPARSNHEPHLQPCLILLNPIEQHPMVFPIQHIEDKPHDPGPLKQCHVPFPSHDLLHKMLQQNTTLTKPLQYLQRATPT